MNTPIFTIILNAFFLTLPLVLSGSIHMYLVSHKKFQTLAKPISIRRFGRSKTWRGFVIMPFATIPCLALIQVLYAKTSESFQLTRLNDQNTWLLGAALGLAYALFELPNSFVKRKVGIPEGQQARGFWQPIFFMFDHFDSLSGITLVYFLFLKIQPSLILALLFTAPVIHTVVNLVLFALKFRKNPL